MSAWAARLAVAGIFLLGFITGAAAMHLCRLQLERSLFRSEAPLAELFVHQLDSELDLSSDQERQIRGIILDIRRETIPELRSTLLPKIVEILDRAHDRIRPVLTESQRARFDELTADRKRLLERMRQGE